MHTAPMRPNSKGKIRKIASTTLADYGQTGFPNQFLRDSWVVGFMEGPTMVDRKAGWEGELGRWLKPFLQRLGHKARQRMCPLYVAGLIGPGDRKSVAPMAEQIGRASCRERWKIRRGGVA